MVTATDFVPEYSPWRHGGWYTNVRYPSGAVGCVSRNYTDGKWRIVCDERPNAHAIYTYPSRDAAARAEKAMIEAAELRCDNCGYSGADRKPDAYPGEDCPRCGGEIK